MEYQTLNNGLKIPTIGFGVFRVPEQRTVNENEQERVKSTPCYSG